VPLETYGEQYQEGVDVLQALADKLQHAFALNYLRRHLRHQVILEELIEVSNFQVDDNVHRFKILCQSYALDDQMLMSLFRWMHTRIKEKVLAEAVEANPAKAVETQVHEWLVGVQRALQGSFARTGSMLTLDGLDWGKLAIKRHLKVLLEEIL